MNRQLTTRALVAVVGLLLGMWGSGAWAAYLNSFHDFGGSGWSGGESCTVCHTPHGQGATGTAADLAPLWDHALSTTSYTPYSSITNTMNATSLDTDFTGISKLCLSCHDGTLSMDNFGGATTTGNAMTGPNVLGTNLSNDHPVSFPYQETITNGDSEFIPALTVFNNQYTYGADETVAKVECVSCHDVHGTTGVDPFLRATKATLCDNCHLK